MELTPVVRDAVEDMFRSGDVHRSEMEPCCFESLRDFTDAVALKIIKDFRDADMHTLRNKTGFFCSLLKQHRAQTGTLRHPSTPGVISTTPWSVRPPTFAPVTPAGYHPPPWPPPQTFRLTKGGKLIAGIFKGETINTPSMLCVEDYLQSLAWAKSIGGLQELIARADANTAAITEFVERHNWITFLASDPATRSNTSVCLKFTDDRIEDGASFAKAVAKRLADEGVALDVGAYRDAPAGLRIWCGGTVETADVKAMLPWLAWAFEAEINS